MTRSLFLIYIILALLHLICARFREEEYFTDMENKTVTEYPDEIAKTTMMYQQTKKDLKMLAKLNDKLARDLSTPYADLLANIVCSTEDFQGRIQTQMKMMFENFDPKLIENILRCFIPEVCKCKTTSKLRYLFWDMYKDSDIKTFEIILQSQLKVFSEFLEKGLRKDVITKFTYYLANLKSLEQYESVKETLQDNVLDFLRAVPGNLQNLLFAPEFCLMNALEPEYIYISEGEKTPDVGLRHAPWLIDDRVFIKAEVYEANDDQGSELLIQLKDSEYDTYYYMMPLTNLVAVWELPTEPPHSIWRLEFVDIISCHISSK